MKSRIRHLQHRRRKILQQTSRQGTPESEDGLLALMRHYGIPITRESYLELAYMGEPPEELSAEEEMNLPPELRKVKG
jgi:hypothetical protein